jgi:uncharacterized small protein (DUF1192 family)
MLLFDWSLEELPDRLTVLSLEVARKNAMRTKRDSEK